MRERQLDGEMRGILFHDARNPTNIISISAGRGALVRQGDEAFLEMFDGHVVTQNTPNGPARVITFQRYVLDLETFQRKAGPNVWKPKERYLHELMYPDPDDPRFKSDPGQFRAEIHERFSSCLYPLAFVLIALAYVGQAQSTRTNRNQALFGGFAAAALLRLVGLALNKLVVLRPEAVPLMYLLPIGAMALATWSMYRNAWPKPVPAWRRNLTARIEDLQSAVRRRILLPFARRQPGE